MGLKNKLNKMKSFLFDEEDEEKEIVKPTKPKEKIKKVKEAEEEIVSKKYEEENKFDDLYFEDVSDIVPDVKQIQSRSSKNENEFKFPDFSDDDFLTSQKAPEPIVIESKREEPKITLYQGSKRKEETKKFKPSPNISPVYGLLDNDGNIAKSSSNKEVNNYEKNEVTFDDVRKKAYGTLDDEIENTLKKLSNKTIAEAEAEMEEKESKLSRSDKKSKKNEVRAAIINETDEDDDDDDMIIPNVNFKEIKIEKNISSSNSKKLVEENDDDDDTKEQDLFNLIDTMYAKKDSDN